MKFAVIYKFLLLSVLIISLLCVVISGVGLFYGWQMGTLFNVHVSFAVLLVVGLLLHVLNRKNKLVKINTQFADLVLHNKYPSYCNLDRLIMTFEHFSVTQIAEQLNLDLDVLLKELVEGKINVKNSHRTLRENFPHNDEKIFASVTIALQLRFTSHLPEKDIKMKKTLLCTAIAIACTTAYTEEVFTLGQIEVISDKSTDLNTVRIDRRIYKKTTKPAPPT